MLTLSLIPEILKGKCEGKKKSVNDIYLKYFIFY